MLVRDYRSTRLFNHNILNTSIFFQDRLEAAEREASTAKTELLSLTSKYSEELGVDRQLDDLNAMIEEQAIANTNTLVCHW